ncbi:MAG: hypothetical protein KAG66_18350, partial [Methylococcales bacterium]|nr:hypothetical protein [Methylococcales bacterium]
MSITKVTKVGFFKRITNSIFGVLIGIVLFLGSFVLLWKNEGRVDLSKIAENSVAVSAETVDSNNESQLIAVSGNLTSDGTLGDGDYLQAGDYISLSRNAEMYAWVQHSDSNTKKNVGGSQTTTTEYT